MRWLVPLLLVAGIASACADPYRPPDGDLEPPFIVGSDPATGAADVGRRPSIRVEFSEPIDAATLNAASILLLSPSGRIAGEVRTEERAASFEPAADLREGTDFRLAVLRTVRDAAGVSLAGDDGPGTDATIAFHTAAVPPTVTGVSPEDGAPAVQDEPSPPVTIAFSEPMDPATVDGRTVTVRDLHGPVAGAVALDAAGTEATFVPAAPWREGRTYSVELAAGCADLSGIPLGGPFLASFTTVAEPPTLTALEPGAPAPIDGFVAAFEASEALAPETVQPWNFAIDPPAAARIAWLPEARRIEVAFTETLLSSVAFTITASTGLADDDGNRLAAPVVFHFATAATPDNNGPGPIAGFEAASLRRAALRLSWIAPGDDVERGAAKGTAASYEVRRSRTRMLDLAAFEAGAPVPVAAPTPAPAGTAESLELPMGLHEPWHYAVLAVDEAGNRSLSPDLLAAVQLADARAAGTAAEGGLGAAVLVADLDADGFPELVAGEPGAARVQVYAGTPEGPALAAPASTIFNGPIGSGFGAALAAGDVDGDGDLDLLVGAPAEDGERGAAYLYLTGPGLPAGDPAVTFRGAELRDRLGAAVALASLDGDAAAETILGVPGAGAGNEGRVLLAGGVPGGLPDPLAPITLGGAAPGEAYGSAFAVGDFDLDGALDLAIGAPGSDAAGIDAGRIELRTAGATRQLHGPAAGGGLGAALATGDADGDGIADLFAGAPLTTGRDGEGFPTAHAGAVHLFAGPIASGANPGWSAEGVAAEGRLGAAVAIAGPLLDGMAGGLVAGAPGSPNAGGERHGEVRLYHVAGDRTITANGVLAGADTFDGFGAALAPGGDLDGDGLHDLAVGAPLADGAASAAGRVHLFR